MLQVQALYDFDAQPGTGELSLNSGDILTVTRKDVGEGWWEGTNAKGESGLFPEAYVEVRIIRIIGIFKLRKSRLQACLNCSKFLYFKGL